MTKIFTSALLRKSTDTTPPPDPGEPPPQPTGQRQIWIYAPNSLSSTILAAYNAKKAQEIYWSAFDTSPSNGDWDQVSLSKLPTSYTGIGMLDWETVTHPTYGKYRVPGVSGGYHNAVSTAHREFVIDQCRTLLAAYRAARPQNLYGFYWFPNANNVKNWLSYSGAIANQHTVGAEWLAETDVISPRHYPTYAEAASSGSTTISDADLQEASENMAIESLKCAENGRPGCLVLPHVSTQYYGSGGDGTAPTEWVYKHAYYFCRTRWNGRAPDGIYIWNGTSSATLTEAQLKAIYQGANELPYDPNMPRPS